MKSHRFCVIDYKFKLIGLKIAEQGTFPKKVHFPVVDSLFIEFYDFFKCIGMNFSNHGGCFFSFGNESSFPFVNEFSLSKTLPCFKQIYLLVFVFDSVVVGGKFFIFDNNWHAQGNCSFQHKIYLLGLLSFIIDDWILIENFYLHIFDDISNEFDFLKRVLNNFLEDIKSYQTLLENGLVEVGLHEWATEVCWPVSVERGEVGAHDFQPAEVIVV